MAFSFRRFGYACALAAPFGGRHRFSSSSPTGVHTPLRSGSLLPSAFPLTHARGTGNGERRRNLSEPFPLTPSRHYKRERGQVACAEVTANRRHPAAARCAYTLSVCLGSAITESEWNVATEGFCNIPSASTEPERSAPVRITPRSCQSSVTAGAAATAPETSGTVVAGERSTRCFSVERPLAGLVKKKNEERRYSPFIASITADPPDNIPLCQSSPLRVYRSLRCAPFGLT